MEVKEEDKEEESKTHQQYSHDEHTGKEKQEARNSSTNEGESGHEGKCLKCNRYVTNFCDNWSL